jgi:hypothetical protein
MQWPQRALDAATAVRRALPERLLCNPYEPGRLLDREVGSPDPVALAADDPSECADSGRIIDCLRGHFPDVEIRLTGGAIYHAALSDVLANIDEDDPTDRALLDLMLQLDVQLANQGLTHYAVAVAERDSISPRRLKRGWRRLFR